MIDKKRSKVHNLNKLLKQCINKSEAIDIYAGKTVNIIYVFRGKDYFINREGRMKIHVEQCEK